MSYPLASRTYPKPSTAALEFLSGAHDLYIDGEWVTGDGREIFVENPAREQLLTTIRSASVDQLDLAVASARSAMAGRWGRTSARDRGVMLNRFTDLLDARADFFAEIMTLDNGSPLASSRMVVRFLAAELFRYYAGWATKISGESFTPTILARLDNDFLVATTRDPIGVVGASMPWNAPPGMLALKMATALAAGCAVVLKTAELAPLVGQIFAQLCEEAGGPRPARSIWCMAMAKILAMPLPPIPASTRSPLPAQPLLAAGLSRRRPEI